jgi:hypothetical protein
MIILTKIFEGICGFNFKYKAPSGGWCDALHIKEFLNL